MKRHSSRRARRVLFTALGLALLMGVYALLPIRGQVIVLTYDSGPSLVWPEMRLEPSSSGTQGSSLGVTDNYPWAHVLLTLDGKSAALRDYAENVGGTWTWHWSLPANATGVVVFYHDCQTGCVERGRFVLGTTRTAPAKLASPARALPTKLGVVFAGTGRDWHGRSGWDVELTYVRLGDRPYWGADDLAERVQAAAEIRRVAEVAKLMVDAGLVVVFP